MVKKKNEKLPKSIKVIGIINIIISIILILFAVGYYLFDILGPSQLVPLLTFFMTISIFIIGIILLIMSVFLLKRNNYARIVFGIFTIIISIWLVLLFAYSVAILFLLILIFHIIEFYFLLINKKIRAAFKNK